MNRIRPSRAEVLLRVAEVIAARSTCDRAQVGAVIAKDGRIIATGYNGPPSGQRHCSNYICNLSVSCQRSVHAEANAIAFAARHGISTLDATIYVMLSPCVDCARLIINAGIKSVIFREPYRDLQGLSMLNASGVEYGHVPPQA